MSEERKELENNLINVTNRDLIYRMKAEELREEYVKALSQSQNEGKLHLVLRRLLPQMDIIATDAYFTHYSVVPLLRSSENPSNILESVRQYLSRYMEGKDYRSIKTITVLNDELSKIYSHALVKEIIKQLEKEMPEDLKEEISRLADKCGGQSGCNAPSNLSCQEKQILAKLEKTVNKVFSNRGKAKQILDKAVEKARKAAENAKEVKRLVGGREAGKEPGTYEKLLNLTLKTLWNRRLRDVIITAGKIIESMPHFVSIDKERDKHGDELYGYRTTKKPWEAIAKEIALPDDVLEAKLSGNGLIAKEKVVTKEGAYYVLIDKSGSMEADKTVWARAVALALFRLARMKGRKYFLRFFDDIVYPSEPIEDPMDVIDAILKIVADGGTDIDRALHVALNDLSERKLSQYTNTIIIITDGEDKVATKPEEFKERNAQLVAVMIQGDNQSLARIAKATGGKYLKAKLSPKGGYLLIEEVM